MFYLKKKLSKLVTPEMEGKISDELKGMYFTKNFRSASAEEWYFFLPNFSDPRAQGAAGKAIIHYNLYGNKDVFINTTVIFNDPDLYSPELLPLVYAIAEELVNRLVGYADTLLSVHAGNNSFDAEYLNKSM